MPGDCKTLQINLKSSMKTTIITNVLTLLLVSLVSTLTMSCNKDIDTEPFDAVTLNMLDELNGKTFLGASNVYINKANNLYSSTSLIADMGSANGLGGTIAPQLNNLVREAAATPGHLFQIFDRETVREFPSGNKALMVDAAYYRVFVVSPITISNQLSGAVVKYTSLYPDKRGLPEYDSELGSLVDVGDRLELELPHGAECYWERSDLFYVVTEGDKLKITLNDTPSSGELGGHPFYIRVGDVFTMVYVSLG